MREEQRAKAAITIDSLQAILPVKEDDEILKEGVSMGEQESESSELSDTEPDDEFDEKSVSLVFFVQLRPC